ncbi:MAG TPA: PQQ-binding-like beta-propeller repeat protein [Blastocatellia bacterium]|nr:PQQ-binding-like beta-propeller repeat protein [Blastocatellia bacterium]
MSRNPYNLSETTHGSVVCHDKTAYTNPISSASSSKVAESMSTGTNYPNCLRKTRVNITALFLALIGINSVLSASPEGAAGAANDASWSAKLDEDIAFYQTTDLGLILAGTKKSLYALDSETGDVMWRRRNLRVDQTDVATVVGTDLVLINHEKDGRSRIEAADIMTGKPVWQSDKLNGSIMHIAVEPESEFAALVLIREAKSHPREGFKRRPTIHVLNLVNGDQLWKRDLGSELEMMPARWSDKDEETEFTLDNYRPPLFLDGRLYLFYEGVTSLDARTGGERIREKFQVNEDGLALTEADPVWDDRYLYASGRGKVRAISRATGRVVWEGKDLGLTPELLLAGGVLYVRTGGQFTQLKDGEVVNRGAYGVTAINSTDGKTLWRYRGADKGITNIALADSNTVLIADRDELIALDAETGKPRVRARHRIERAAFVLINENGQAVVGGKNELAGYELVRSSEAVWRARHEAPGRGVLRTVAAIAARAVAIYFRYGGVATTAFRGARFAAGARSLRWTGLASRVGYPNLTDFAAGAAREYVGTPVRFYGAASRVDRVRRSLQQPRPPDISVDVEDRLLDRLDPAHQLDRLSRFLWRRQRLAVLRGEFMYFYTELEGEGGRGLAGVNLNTGRTERAIKLSDPDYRLTTDEVVGRLFVAKGNTLRSHSLAGR